MQKNVLDISKVESGMVELSYMDVHLPSVMRDLYNMMKLRMPQSISFAMDSCADILFNTDKARFVQLKNFKQGIGLELPICKGFITTMGGRIFAESKVGVGSTFSFVLPLDRKA